MIMLSTLVGAVINVLVCTIGIPLIGVYGALIANVLSYLIIVVIRFIDTRRIVRLNINFYRLLGGFVLILLQAVLFTLNLKVTIGIGCLLSITIIIINASLLFSLFKFLLILVRKNKCDEKILLVYGDIRTVNIGDYIQSLAAKQYFDDEDYELVNRDELGLYSGVPAKVIMNAWLTYKPENWPPSNKITPLFVALHINSSVEKIMLSPENIGYFKKYEPIGCRDIYTMNLFKSRGVDAYFSSCLTTTLDLTYKVPKHREGIYIVDPLAYMPNGKGVIEILKTLFQTILNVKSVLHIIRNYRKIISTNFVCLRSESDESY